jgi:hypothetical protein
MAQVATYSTLLSDLIERYASGKKSLTPQVKWHALIDHEHGEYQLLSMGWHNNRYVFTVAFHFSLRDHKIWIQQNNTDLLIADELVALGVPPTDIVLGFVPEQARAASGFGVG